MCLRSYTYTFAEIVPKKLISIPLSGNGRDHDSRFACVFRLAGSRSVKWDTWNFELVQMVFGTLGALSFIFTTENCCLGQVQF